MSLKYSETLTRQDLKEIDRMARDLSAALDGPSQTAMDVDPDPDPDPEGEASRLAMVATDLYREERKRNERQAALAEYHAAKRFKEMNKLGLRSQI